MQRKLAEAEKMEEDALLRLQNSQRLRDDYLESASMYRESRYGSNNRGGGSGRSGAPPPQLPKRNFSLKGGPTKQLMGVAGRNSAPGGAVPGIPSMGMGGRPLGRQTALSNHSGASPGQLSHNRTGSLGGTRPKAMSNLSASPGTFGRAPSGRGPPGVRPPTAPERRIPQYMQKMRQGLPDQSGVLDGSLAPSPVGVVPAVGGPAGGPTTEVAPGEFSWTHGPAVAPTSKRPASSRGRMVGVGGASESVTTAETGAVA